MSLTTILISKGLGKRLRHKIVMFKSKLDLQHLDAITQPNVFKHSIMKLVDRNPNRFSHMLKDGHTSKSIQHHVAEKLSRHASR